MPTSTCRLLPHGSYTVWIATMSTIAWCASLFQDGCDYAKVTGSIVSELASRPDVPYLEFGLGAYREPEPVGFMISSESGGNSGDGSSAGRTIQWAVNYDGACTEYPFEVDIYWKLSKAAAFLALVIGGGGTLFVWCSTCFVFSKGTWKWAGYELLVAATCQAIAFLWFLNGSCHSDSSRCIMFWGSKANIIATICWYLSGICVLLRYPTPIEEQLLQQQQQQEEEQVNGGNGDNDDATSSNGGGGDLTVSSVTLSSSSTNGGGLMMATSGLTPSVHDSEPIRSNAEMI